MRLFKPPQAIGEVISTTVRKLKVQRAKLDYATARLRNRDQILFQACVTQLRRNHRERATICANELAEVRKVLKMVMHCQLALERVILRLETVKEVSEIMGDLRPALKNLHGLTRNLVNIMPDVASELERLNNSISETLAVATLGPSDSLEPFVVKTPAGEEILKEVSAAVEERLTEQLPEPPVSVAPEKTGTPQNIKRQMISLSASCSEITRPLEQDEKGKESKSYVTYKDVALHKVSFTIQEQSRLEDALLQYAKKTAGEIDVAQCASELNVPYDAVEKALESLGKKQKILIQR